jgi:hypothetical protein
MAHFDPISFLPEDKIGPALQNLAQTQQAIGNAKIQEMQGQITAFNNLLDVSLEGLMTKHQEEVVGDVDKFKDHAAELYRNAFEGGGRPNFKDISTLNTEKKQILYKVNQSKFLQDQYKQAMLKASVLGDKIGPTVKDDLTKWLHQSETIGATADPMSLVNMKYDMLDMTDDYDKLIKGTKDSALKSPQSVMNPKTGKEERRVIWDPKEQSDVIWDNIPRISDFWTKKAGGDTRKGKQMYDAWTQEQSVNALDLQGGTTVNNFMNPWGVKEKPVLFTYDESKNKTWSFPQYPINYTKGDVKGSVVGVKKIGDEWYGSFSAPLIDEKMRKNLFQQGAIETVDKENNKVYLVKLDASDYGAVEGAGLKLEDADLAGWANLREQREQTSKAAPIKVNLTPVQLKSLKSPGTIIITPGGEMTMKDLMIEKGLAEWQIQKGIEQGTLSFK